MESHSEEGQVELKPEDDVDLSDRRLIKAFQVVAGLWATCGIVLYWVPDHGTFGDMFGAVNALFSGLAFAALYFTLTMQRRELALQRAELRMTRDELKLTRLESTAQTKQLEAQSETFKQQRFESTFFELARMLTQIASSVRIAVRYHDEEQKLGTHAFVEMIEDFRRAYKIQKARSPNEDEVNIVAKAYESFMETHQLVVGHYFRHLAQVLKFVATSGGDRKQLYYDILSAQMAVPEVILTSYVLLQERNHVWRLALEAELFSGLETHELLAPSHASFFPSGTIH